MKMAEEVKDVKRTAKDYVRKSSKSSVIMSNRLQRSKDLKLLVGELKEELADESHPRESIQIMSTILLQIKRERNIGRRGGSLRWTVHIIMLICEFSLWMEIHPLPFQLTSKQCMLLLLEVKWMSYHNLTMCVSVMLLCRIQTICLLLVD